MSTERKPLAEAVDDVGDFGPGRRLVVAGVGMGVFTYDTDQVNLSSAGAVDQAIAIINAAVEAREAPLKVAFRGLRQAVIDAQVAIEHGTPAPWPIIEKARLESLPAFYEAIDAVSGDVACGLAFDLGVEQQRTRDAWGVLLQEMSETGPHGWSVARKLAIALGLIGDVLTHDPPMRVPASMPNLPSELRPGQVFGWDPGLSPDEAVLIQHDASGRPRNVVRIRNIDTGTGGSVERTGTEAAREVADQVMANAVAAARWNGQPTTQCTSVVGLSYRCELPVGHAGQHEVRLGLGRTRYW